MPPKLKVTKEEVLSAALDFVREEGIDGLNARAIAKRLSCSTQPIFSNFGSMVELRSAVIARALEINAEYAEREIALKKYPPYKAIGMAYVRFAQEEKELFKLLYMRKIAREEGSVLTQWEDVVVRVQATSGLSRKDAELMHAEMWAVVHGIATMMATGYLEWDFDTVSEILTDAFEGIKTRFPKK